MQGIQTSRTQIRNFPDRGGAREHLRLRHYVMRASFIVDAHSRLPPRPFVPQTRNMSSVHTFKLGTSTKVDKTTRRASTNDFAVVRSVDGNTPGNLADILIFTDKADADLVAGWVASAAGAVESADVAAAIGRAKTEHKGMTWRMALGGGWRAAAARGAAGRW